MQNKKGHREPRRNTKSRCTKTRKDTENHDETQTPGVHTMGINNMYMLQILTRTEYPQ